MLRSNSFLRVNNRRIPYVHEPRHVDGEYRSEEVLENITNQKGEVVRTIRSEHFRFHPVDETSNFHRGETADMYSITNLQKAGVELKKITTPYGILGLQDKSDYADYLDSVKLDDLKVETPSPSGDTIKF